MIKARIGLFLLSASFLVLTGCEGSKYPMSDPAESTIEEGFIGSWIVESPDGDEASYLNILPFNEHEYYGEVWEPGNEDELVRLGIFSTRLNGVWFANIRCLLCDEDDGQYFFFKYDLLSETEFSAVPINEDLQKELRELDSIDAVRSLILNRMKDSDFLDEEEGVYRKLDEMVWPWDTVE